MCKRSLLAEFRFLRRPLKFDPLRLFVESLLWSITSECCARVIVNKARVNTALLEYSKTCTSQAQLAQLGC